MLYLCGTETSNLYTIMTTEEVHNYNRRLAVSDISYEAVCTNEKIVEFRKWMTAWLDMAYEAGFKAAKEGKI